MSSFEVPKLEGWVTISEAAEILGISRQAVHKMVNSGKFRSARKIGSSKPVFVVRAAEVSKAAL